MLSRDAAGDGAPLQQLRCSHPTARPSQRRQAVAVCEKPSSHTLAGGEAARGRGADLLCWRERPAALPPDRGNVEHRRHRQGLLRLRQAHAAVSRLLTATGCLLDVHVWCLKCWVREGQHGTSTSLTRAAATSTRRCERIAQFIACTWLHALLAAGVASLLYRTLPIHSSMLTHAMHNPPTQPQAHFSGGGRVQCRATLVFTAACSRMQPCNTRATSGTFQGRRARSVSRSGCWTAARTPTRSTATRARRWRCEGHTAATSHCLPSMPLCSMLACIASAFLQRNPNPVYYCALAIKQEAVRNDHVEVVRLMQSHRGKVMEDGQVRAVMLWGADIAIALVRAPWCICFSASNVLQRRSRGAYANTNTTHTNKTHTAGCAGPVAAARPRQHAV